MSNTGKTAETIEKLLPIHRSRLEYYSNMKSRQERIGNKEEANKFTQKILGYVQCLLDNEQVNLLESRQLHLYYATVRKEVTNGKK